MPKFEVIRPWHGAAMGVVFDAESVNPALASHVRQVPDDTKSTLVVATPAADSAKSLSKGDVIAELKKQGIQFDGRKSAEELSALLEAGGK